jgi:hypothetical protein
MLFKAEVFYIRSYTREHVSIRILGSNILQAHAFLVLVNFILTSGVC